MVYGFDLSIESIQLSIIRSIPLSWNHSLVNSKEGQYSAMKAIIMAFPNRLVSINRLALNYYNSFKVDIKVHERKVNENRPCLKLNKADQCL